MARRADSKKSLSMKTRLILIAIMFVIINLIFYFGFDSSDESGENKELDISIMFNDEIESNSQYDLLEKVNENLDVF
jgi:uncharacterized membrane protein YvbJ